MPRLPRHASTTKPRASRPRLFFALVSSPSPPAETAVSTFARTSSPSLPPLEQKTSIAVNRRRKNIADREDPHRQESIRHQAIEDLTDNTLGMHR
jgi:hypothetical protein